ncbi:MAG: A/G-specific adenine glycosylase [Bdellovibrionaceae bacterium]|nr:A/G-specific adenine glycosylase [Pseudobdellovibrionaceae bacterium]
MPPSRQQTPTKPKAKQSASPVRRPKFGAAATELPSLKAPVAFLATHLTSWYLENRRELPWRVNRDPYRIWISEVMLQQTTVTAVIPYYEKFMHEFPELHLLARAPVERVLELWTGLGYYSRARNLHKSAQALAALTEWPRTHEALLEQPGFGPYTSRAVSSLAFGESVGVLDGNVIRVLSRVAGAPIEHWTNKGRLVLQDLADRVAREGDPAVINQGMMELGATICTPKSPQCLLCPWFDPCESRKANSQAQLPLKKPRKDIETWVWVPTLHLKGDKVGLVKNDYAPFLKGQWMFPGRAERRAQKPKKFDLRHGITHHDIYVHIEDGTSARPKDLEWVSIRELTKWNPSILLRKVLENRRAKA